MDSLRTTTFTWNEENQLTQVALPTSLTVNYKYDGLGRRIQRTTSARANKRYVYDGQDVLLDLNADWSVATTYVSDLGIDNKLRQTSSTTGVSYFLTDHLGSTAGLTDASGSLLEQLSYDSFGNSTGSPRSRYGYTGRERDPDTGLLYYRARWHDPEVGRFISEDPIGFLGRDLNLYGYVHNDPLRLIDPSGLRRCHPLLGALVGGLVGGVGGAGVGAGLGALAGGAIGVAGGTLVIPGFGQSRVAEVA
jgi:RHS repeat-associated protein